jgi:spore coat polysaccharide biosynthesis protein SpsF (cytidylyltransferase family)
MRKAIFITVRTVSTRLPEKALLKINERSTIELVIDRVKKSKKAQIIVLCTTEAKNDDILCEIAKNNGILFFRGSAEDKLMRWKGAAEKYDVEFFVTSDGDDLLCDPELIDLAFEQYERSGADFIEGKNVPCGGFTYGIKVSALNKVCEIKESTDTEMMWVYFTDTGLFKIEMLQNIPKVLQRPEIRMTLDYDDDLKFFKIIFDHFADNPAFTLRDVVKFLDENPDVIKINQYLQERFLDNQRSKTKLVLKKEVNE